MEVGNWEVKNEIPVTLLYDMSARYKVPFRHVRSATLLTAACFFNGETQTFLICTDSKHNNRNTILVFVEHFFENYIMKDENDSTHDVEKII